MTTQSNQANQGPIPKLSSSKKSTKSAWYMTLGALSLLSLTSISGCSSMHSRRTSEVSDGNTSAYVNGHMDNVINSVDTSLKNLVQLERGDEGPRKNTPLGSTIAGAAGPNAAPYAMASKAALDTPLGQSQNNERLHQNREILNTRVKLDWEGESSGFLSALAGKVGYRFSIVGNGIDPLIKIHVKDATIQSVLTDVANQINQKADIHVDIDTRCISLVYH